MTTQLERKVCIMASDKPASKWLTILVVAVLFILTAIFLVWLLSPGVAAI